MEADQLHSPYHTSHLAGQYGLGGCSASLEKSFWPSLFTMRFYQLVLLLILPLLLTGCLTSVDPVFDDDQIVNDPHIEGHFSNQDKDGQPLKSKWHIQQMIDSPTHYHVWVEDGPASLELVATLFRLDKALYLDLYPIGDSGQWHKPSEPQTESEMLHSVVFDARHLIWKVEISDASISYAVPTRNGVGQAVGLVPELRTSVRAVGELAIILLPKSKKEAQECLKKFGENPKIFDWNGKLMKNPGP
jgi:hypothetical protein